MNVIEHTALYFREGGSDKVYHAQINEVQGGFTVTFSYGRRGSALKDGTKTSTPVPLEQARLIFSKLVAEKQSKGYATGQDAAPFSDVSSFEDSKIRCQLLNPVEEHEALAILNDGHYWVQEKMDGERRLISRDNGVVRGINRKGLYLALCDSILDSISGVPEGDFIIDGEQVGDVFYAFDLLVDPVRGDVRSRPFSERYSFLSSLLLDNAIGASIRLVPVAYALGNKRAHYSVVRARGGEGVVFKHLDAAYSAGRPASGGSQLKFKFTESCSVVVSKVNGDRRSVAVSAYGDAGLVVSLGNVTIPPNHAIPGVGDVVEVRYLYCGRNGGSLFQPVYRGPRNDIDASECLMSQIKFKPETAECDAG